MKAYVKAGMAAAIVLAAAGCGGKAGSEAAQATTTPPPATLGASDVAQASRATLRQGVAISGSLEPKVNITVGAPIAEQVAEMFVDEGDAVRQGQPVARFRDDVLRASAASSRADVATARMQVTIAVAESSRADALFGEGAIARRDHDNALLAVESARARLALTEAQSANADDRLETATLKAPATGVISRRYVQAGDRVDFGKPVVDLVDTRTLQLAASVPTEFLAELRIGRPVSLRVAQLEGADIAGRISRINPTADPATRQVKIYVDIPNAGSRLVGGLFASGRVVTHEVVGAVAVPGAAVRYEGEERAPVVYVVDRGKVARRPVGVGIADEALSLVQITSGLAAGETVIVGPIEGLSDGSPVEISGSPREAAGGPTR
jgi:RND family efflux transporter MFP subunit